MFMIYLDFVDATTLVLAFITLHLILRSFPCINSSFCGWQAREKHRQEHHPLESAVHLLTNNLRSKFNYMRTLIMLKEQRSLKIERLFMNVPLSFLKAQTPRSIHEREKIPCFLDTIEKVLNVPKFKGSCGYLDTSNAYNKDELDMDEVLRVIGKEETTWWEDPQAPIIPARPKKEILNNEAWMWMKLIVCNIIPTRHETTLRMEIVLLIYALMKNVSVSLLSVMNFTMNADPTKSKTHLLPYPMFITKWAQDANDPRLLRDEILKIPKSQQFFPFEK
ncbi:hypothetical protein PIB30_092174 [Stylosanthes scabra]|uniref:Putative plant transposon protein domain-containing protein n=1 Tax=Stylosanthes scabra TaxID=79078 RepID=A0ABU6WT45_9FABA|nr:hypothetical protein [Stylosanthes scabra]